MGLVRLLTVAGVVLTIVSVILLVVSVLAEPESRRRFLANWWALVFVYVGVVFMLTGELL